MQFNSVLRHVEAHIYVRDTVMGTCLNPDPKPQPCAVGCRDTTGNIPVAKLTVQIAA